MEVVLELFLLDNFLMDALVLNIAGALCGRKQRVWGSVAAAALGSVYAALSMALGGVWALWPVKLLISFAMIALAFRFCRWREAGVCALCFYAATAITGGIAFALLSLLGGAFDGGVLLLPDTLRPALLALCVAAVLPRAIRHFVAKRRLSTHVRLRIHWRHRTDEVYALVDTGNALSEPISATPVIVVSADKMPHIEEGKGRAVAYSTLDGQGMLWAQKPLRVEARLAGGWRDMPAAYVAASPRPLQRGVDAIAGAQWMAMADSRPLPGADNSLTTNTKNAGG